MMIPKTIVITGTSSGIGLELCRQLSLHPDVGCIYALCRRPSAALSELGSIVVEHAKAVPGTAVAAAAATSTTVNTLIEPDSSNNQNKVWIVPNIDVTDTTHMCESLRGLFGSMDIGPELSSSPSSMVPIDWLIHNAGAYGPDEVKGAIAVADDLYQSQTLEQITPERMMYAMQLNAFAPLFLTRALLPNLQHAKRMRQGHATSNSSDDDDQSTPKVIIMSSLMGSIKNNTSGGHYGYRTAKAAVNMIGKNLAMDLKPRGIAVGVLHPGFVQTQFDGGNGPLRPGQRYVDESVQGLLQAMDQITLSTTGSFLHGNYGEGVLPLEW